jgi:thiosulfate dehydrogenase [quinone] large subunit
MRESAETRVAGIGLAILRITIGMVWLHEAAWKIPPSFGVFRNWVTRPLEFPVSTTYNAVVEAVILPNFILFAWTVLILEAALGAFLIVGLLTRLWAALGLMMSVPIYLSVANYSVTSAEGMTLSEWSWAYWMMMAIHAALLATGAGRHYGLDGVLRDSWAASRRRGVRLLAWLS